MAEPLVIQAINQWRELYQAKDAKTMRDLARRWLEVENRLRGDMLELAMYLDELRAGGQTITTARLMQMERYQQLIRAARAEQTKFAEWADGMVRGNQVEMVRDGVTGAQETIRAAMADGNVLGISFNRINTAAVNYAIGYAADGSPLYDLLRASYPESVVKLTDNLVKGLAAGLGPAKTARLMQESMAGNLDRALTIARTEQIRALRAGSLEQMQQSQVVSGYIRRAQRSGNVCAACLALDGTELASDEVFESHPNCMCYPQPVLKYGKTPAFPSGPEWFAEQKEATQREILGPGKFKLFQEGRLDWGRVTSIQEDPVWGPTIRLTAVAELG